MQVNLPTQTQMLLPLLEAIHDAGGVAKPGEIYDAVAARLGISDDVRSATITGKDKEEVNIFQRRLRWTKQTAVVRGLIESETRGVWALTDSANAKLRNVVRGAVLTIFESDRGVFLWANAEDAIGIIERESIDLLLSSPPYPLISSKAYGNLDETKWVDWMLKICEGSRELLRPTGSIILNLGNCWMPGRPQQSLYIQRLLVRLEDSLGIHLCQELFWHSPTKLPVPLEWVGVRRVRLTPSVEPLLWLSPNPELVNSDNRRVLRAYSASGLRSINNERDREGNRPNGVQFGKNSFVDRGGSIPPSLITATPCSVEERRYREAIAAAGRKPHPAIMPAAVARFCIELTTEKGDIVADLFSGSGTVPIEAMKLDRYAIAVDRSLEYIESSEIRCQAEGIATRRLVMAA